jgi:hypothetical protein
LAKAGAVMMLGGALSKGAGVSAQIPLGSLLDVLAPNALLKEKFREGWRACEIARRGMRPPLDLHRVNNAVSELRSQAKRAFAKLRVFEPCGLEFVLGTSRSIDDDGWLFLVKPVLDGMTDAGCWHKDRRVVDRIEGHLSRDRLGWVGGDVLLVRVVLS